MKYLASFCLVFWAVCLSVIAQDRYTINNSANGPLEDAISQLADQSGLSFYYAPDWVDTIQVSQNSISGSLQEVLDELFSETKLNYLFLEDKVILTYNTPIITKIELDTARESSVVQSEYVFTREYSNESENLEDRTFIIGRKSNANVGGSSILAGFVKNMESGEPLVGAYIQSDITTTTSDNSGFYSLRVPNGKSEIALQFTGMKPTRRKVVVFSDGNLNIDMTPDVVVMENFTIRADADANVTGVNMGIYKFELDELKNVPKVLGENDILKVALTLPGVQNIGEGAAGINVRGGKSDQNLILFNNATIYNPFHYFGFFSSFNADVLESTELYKSSLPVNLGGRLSAVLDVKSRVGDKEKFGGKGGIGIITSSLSLDVPIIKEKTSLMVGGRTTYSDWILNFVNDEDVSNSDPFFYDLSGGLDHVYGKNNFINLSAYYSYDQFKLSTDSLYAYSNLGVSLNWEHNFSEKLSASLSATTSNYDYSIDFESVPQDAFAYDFSLKDYFGQLNLDYTLNDQHTLKIGGDAKFYELSPITLSPSGESSNVLFEDVTGEKGIESAFFISDDIRISDRLSVYGGLRYSSFTALGPGEQITFQEGGPKNVDTILDTLSFSNGESIETYHGPEYRVSLRYSLTDTRSIKASFNRTRQYLHALSNTVSVSPTDVWKLSDTNIKPQISDQYSLGVFENFKNNSIETSVEVYYRDLQNSIDYKTNADLVLNQNLAADVLQGDGRAYGVELLLKKNTGKLNGWTSYTYSRTLQRFESQFAEETINQGSFFPNNFDKPHILNVVANYKLTKRYSFSMNVNFSSGRPVTFPTATYRLGAAQLVHFSDRNEFRIPNTFRVDIGVNIEGSHKTKKIAHGFWSFNIYNLFGRDNPYSIFFGNNNGEVQGFQLAVLGAPIPSISYKFEF